MEVPQKIPKASYAVLRNMTLALPLTDDQLVSELWARDVRFLMGKQTTPVPLLDPAHLIASLAQSGDARVRLSLIPLFLRHPEFAPETPIAEGLLLSQAEKIILHFFYSAAVLLQRKYWKQIVEFLDEQKELPDIFSDEMGIILDADPNQALPQPGKHHQALSGRQINWVGTYEHAAEVWLKEMELQKA
jgi:hypothetical protein